VTRGTHSRRPPGRVLLRRRLTVGAAVLLAAAGIAYAASAATGSGGSGPTPASRGTSSRGTSSHSTAPRTAGHATATTTTFPPLRHVPPGPPTDQRRLSVLTTIGGNISPKSVDASDTGYVLANNMMYRHTITVYDSAGSLVKTIPDTVDMSSFGIPGHPGVTHGAPVEAAYTPDAKYAYVSNYSMYGAGFGPEGSDTCTPASARAAGDTNSYVYRVNMQTLAIDQVIEVGLVPKYVAVSPDGKWLLVSNWCSFDLSIVDIAQAKEVARLPMGAYPRGIAVSPDSSVAYVAVMGGSSVNKIDLRTLTQVGSFYVGSNPRHLVIDPAGRYLYVTLNAPGDAVKVDLAGDKVLATVHTGSDERSMAISTDGRSLYVVNYQSDTITKLRTSDMAVLQTLPTGVNPIGISYDATTGNVWVAVYTGQILVLADR
jgi:YVTN family beta-propeller protein